MGRAHAARPTSLTQLFRIAFTVAAYSAAASLHPFESHRTAVVIAR